MLCGACLAVGAVGIGITGVGILLPYQIPFLPRETYERRFLF